MSFCRAAVILGVEMLVASALTSWSWSDAPRSTEAGAGQLPLPLLWLHPPCNGPSGPDPKSEGAEVLQEHLEPGRPRAEGASSTSIQGTRYSLNEINIV